MELPFDLALTDPAIQRLAFTLLLILLAYVLTRVGKRVVPRYVDDPARRYRAQRLIVRLVASVAVVSIILLWSPGQRDVLTVLTVIGAGVALALREVLLSLVGWLHLVMRAPYRQGERIEVNGVRGDVIDVRMLHSTMMEIGGWVDAEQSTGRLVHVPNSWVFLYPVYNYTRGFRFIWNEIAVTVTFRSDWKAAREIMLSLAQVSADIVEQQAKEELRRMSRDYLVHFSILTPFVYVRLVDNGVRLTLRYLCEARKRRGTEHALTISMLDAFKEHGSIELAYPMVGLSKFETPQFGPLPGDALPPAGA